MMPKTIQLNLIEYMTMGIVGNLTKAYLKYVIVGGMGCSRCIPSTYPPRSRGLYEGGEPESKRVVFEVMWLH